MLTPLFAALAFLSAVLLSTLTELSLSFVFIFVPVLFFLKRPQAAFLLLCVLLGFWRVEFYEQQAPDQAPYGWVELTGRIVEEVDRRQDHQKITVQTEQGRVLAKISLYEQVAFGEEVEISGFLEAPSSDIDGFSYANFLARYRVWLVMNRAEVLVLSPARASPRGFLFTFKDKLEQRLNQLYFEPEASFAAGLLLGSRKGMPQELAEAFQKVGLTHIVAISGYNITLVVAAMFLMFSFLDLKTRVIVSSVAILVFVILVGASAAVVRAGIMGTLTLWALFSGRKSQVFFALLWSAVIMVLLNPYILVFDVGFQLSFASTFGLLAFVPILERFLPGKGVLREAFVLTMAAQIATFPLMAFHFGRISLLSPLANVLVAPFLPFAMLFAALSLVFGKSAALFAWFHLRTVELTALFLAKWPYAEIRMDWSALDFVLSLILMALGLSFFYRSKLVLAFGLSRQVALSTLSHLASEKRAK